jgi:hypothetical protein
MSKAGHRSHKKSEVRRRKHHKIKRDKRIVAKTEMSLAGMTPNEISVKHGRQVRSEVCAAEAARYAKIASERRLAAQVAEIRDEEDRRILEALENSGVNRDEGRL